MTTTAVVVGNPKPQSRTLASALHVARELSGGEPDLVVDLATLDPRTLLDWTDPNVTDLVKQVGDVRVRPVEQRRAELGEVDHEVRVTGQLLRDVRRRGEGAALGLGVADDDSNGGHRASFGMRVVRRPTAPMRCEPPRRAGCGRGGDGSPVGCSGGHDHPITHFHFTRLTYTTLGSRCRPGSPIA